MFHQGTFFNHATYSLWQASRLASRRLGKLIRRYYLLLLFLLSIPVMLYRIKDNPRAVIWSDAEGYYQYLPALFIIRDVHQLPYGSVWPNYNAQGEYVNKYTCGLAYFEAPFFFVAYFLSEWVGYDRMDYFNPVYCYSIAFCGLIIAFLGLFYLKKSLQKRTSSGITFLVLCSVFLGTNLFHYATREMSVSHVFSFFLFAVLLYRVPQFLKNPTTLNSLFIGGLLGWIVLIRPTNIIIAAVLILYDVYSWHAFKSRFLFLVKHMRFILLMLPAAIIPIIPQLYYWQEMTGHWFYYSYTNEGFPYWNQPRILAVLFDTQNGLFLYSPLVLLMFAGIVYGIRKKAFQSLAALIIISVATYIFASWWAWWFGGAFGHRCYVEFYALLAFPLTGLYQHMYRRSPVFDKISFFTFTVLLMFVSVRLSLLYDTLGGPWDGPEWRWAWDNYLALLRHLIEW